MLWFAYAVPQADTNPVDVTMFPCPRLLHAPPRPPPPSGGLDVANARQVV